MLKLKNLSSSVSTPDSPKSSLRRISILSKYSSSSLSSSCSFPSSQDETGKKDIELGETGVKFLEKVMGGSQEVRDNLIAKLLAAHNSLFIEVRLLSAILEFEGTQNKKEKAIKQKKILEWFFSQQQQQQDSSSASKITKVEQIKALILESLLKNELILDFLSDLWVIYIYLYIYRLYY